jgi:hypothetical protein
MCSLSQKLVGRHFWATFSQSHPVTLPLTQKGSNSQETENKESVAPLLKRAEFFFVVESRKGNKGSMLQNKSFAAQHFNSQQQNL